MSKMLLFTIAIFIVYLFYGGLNKISLFAFLGEHIPFSRSIVHWRSPLGFFNFLALQTNSNERRTSQNLLLHQRDPISICNSGYGLSRDLQPRLLRLSSFCINLLGNCVLALPSTLPLFSPLSTPFLFDVAAHRDGPSHSPEPEAI
jgi:hypothetical protein